MSNPPPSTTPSTTTTTTPTPSSTDAGREAAINQYRRKFLEHKELEARVKKSRFDLRNLVKEFDKTEDDLKAVQNVGQIIGEVLKQLDEDRFIVKASSGPRYVVGCRGKLDKKKLTTGTRVSLDMTTLTIMRRLPREVDPMVFNMLNESPGSVSYSDIGGLNDQIRELREVIELPLTNPELFKRVGIKPPKGVLLYGPPGTGKTLLARALANNIKASYLKVVASAIVDKYIGESARVIREMFGYAKDHQPCFDPNTQVLMADSNVKVIKDIVVGDKVWGDDGIVRNVIGLIPLTNGQMYKVSQDKADSYIVNGLHTLVLRATDVTPVVRDNHTNGWRLEYKVRCAGRCAGIHTASKVYQTKVEADAAAANITTIDRNAVKEGDIYEMTITQWNNLCTEEAKLHLQGFKVPVPYQSHTAKSGLATRIKVEPTSQVQQYCGIQVDGNGRFLLADCTVVHNCVIFMDEIDAIGGRRFSQGTSADREIQRTLMELLNQLDGFDDLGKVKMVMATNRPDTLDPALLRPGRLDRKIEIPLPNESHRLDILKIHSANIAKHGDIDYEAVVKLCDGFNGADLRNVCTEAGMFAIRVERAYVIEEDFMKAARKIAEVKKLEGKLDYEKV